MWWSLNKTVKNVKDMYDYAKDNSLLLLSDYSSEDVTSDFWQPYTTNNTEYDRLFCRTFKSYRFFDQEVDQDNAIADVTSDFIDAVYDHLMINDKKYTMLYKLHVLSTGNVLTDNPLNDYSITETRTGSRSVESEYVSGSRTDSSETVSGRRVDTTDDTLGARTDTSTDQVMAFNSTDFVDSAKTTSTKGQEVNQSDFVKGEQTDTDSYTKGSQTDSSSIDEDVDNLVTVKGNKERQSENIQAYVDVWSEYEFYKYIFKEIAKDLLLV